ncbi:MAG: hypothetical protein K6T83_08855 [Alicyclobacillus sp.]|nr:hypothetical protein [Alicyclobacillus sp.]
MNDVLLHMRIWMKKGLATALFLLLLVGSGAAALSVLAAVVTGLSGATSQMSSRSLTHPANGAAATNNKSMSDYSTSDNAISDVATSDKSTSASANREVAASPTPANDVLLANESLGTSSLDHMVSPVGEMLDSGGYALGSRLEQGFGSLLSGLLQTLFLERHETIPAGAGQPPVGRR